MPVSRPDDLGPTPVKCRIFGHLLDFRAEGDLMRWECARGCGTIGTKRYATADEAKHYAAKFDRRDSDALGRHAPLLGMFPLRLWHKFRRPR